MKCIEHTFHELIKAFNSFDFFYPVFGLTESRKQVGNNKQIVFEIRTKEQGHNVPHLHACYEDKNISISLVDFSILAGNIPKKQESLAIEWTKKHIDFLRSQWKEYHKFLIPVL